MNLKLFFALSLVIVTLPHSFAQAVHKETEDEKEIKAGKEAVKDVEKSLKLVNEPAIQERVTRVGKKLALIANSTVVPAGWGSSRLSKFDYTFKVVQDKDVNAFSLPGGFIYINKGLVDIVESDDELAGVLAHEISHASHHHLMALSKKEAKLSTETLISMLVAVVLGSKSENLGNITEGIRLFQTARLYSYSQEAEKDADATGAHYMLLSTYNPVGMVTFMERLKRIELLKPNIDWGIYRSHPQTEDRIIAMHKILQEAHIPYRPSLVTTSLRVDASPIKDDKSGRYHVTYNSEELFVFGGSPEISKARAVNFAEQFDFFLDGQPEMFEIHPDALNHGIIAGSASVLTVTDDDAAVVGTTVEKLIASTAAKLKHAVGAYRMKRGS